MIDFKIANSNYFDIASDRFHLSSTAAKYDNFLQRQWI